MKEMIGMDFNLEAFVVIGIFFLIVAMILCLPVWLLSRYRTRKRQNRMPVSGTAKTDTVKNERYPLISLIAGIIAATSLCVAYILSFLFPVPPGHRSLLYSSAGPIIFILTAVPQVLGPVALFTGISGIRIVSKGKLPERNKAKAVTGIICGGVTCLEETERSAIDKGQK
jgi:hypothetical protein